MTRWIGKRGLWGAAVGVAVAAGSVLVAAEPGDTVVFKEGTKDRKVTVTKVNKRADGSVEVQGKDAATGEVMSWVEGGGDVPPAPPAAGKATAPAAPATKAPVAAAAAVKDTGSLPKAKARTEDPMGSTVAPMAETAAERDRRLFNGKLLGRESATPPPAAAAALPQVAEAGEPKAKTGLLNRLFGKKPAPVPTAMPGPAITTPTPAAPVVKGPATVVGEPRVAAPSRPVAPTPAPAVKSTPVAVPSPVIPVPMLLPATRPAPAPVATPTAVPVPTPAAIPVPMPLPPVVPLPTIPSAPGGAQSMRPGDPVHVILPVGYVPAEVAMSEDLRPFAATLKDGPAPAERLIAAKGLAEGRHGSTDQVKAMLFAAARDDASAIVRASCVDHLAKLGYYHPEFIAHLHRLSEGTAGTERDAARAALVRMTPRKW